MEVPPLCAVYDDGLGYLWIPSFIGLYRLQKENETYQSYTVKQNIAHDEFNFYSHARLQDGRLAFGGLNGVTLVDPKLVDLLDEQQPPFRLELCNGLVSDGRSERKVFLQNKVPITFFGQSENLEIDCHLLDFRSEQKGRIAYQLAGLSQKWEFLDANKLRLERIPFGDYVLRVRALTFDDLSKGNEWEIPIHAVRP